MPTTTERPGAITFRGKPMTLLGPEIELGQAAPDFSLTAAGLVPFSLEEAIDGGNQIAVLITVPSLDTPTCALETSTFHARRAELPAGIAAFIVSVDLPFAQARWAGANQAEEGLSYLSDYRDHSFGRAYGVAIKELDLLARAVFVVKRDRTIGYRQLVTEVSGEPNYDEVFAALRTIAVEGRGAS